MMFLTIILVSTMVFTACSSSKMSENDSFDGSEEVKQVTIEIWHTYSDTEEKIFNEQVIPLFEKEHPNIKVKSTRMPYEGLKQQVIAGVAGDAAPDLMRMDIIWVPEFAKMGALEKLDDKPGFNEIKDTLFPGSFATNQFNGSYYGLPMNTNTKVAIYNKNLLKEAGFSEPPKTFDELIAAAKVIKEKGKFGIGIGGAHPWNTLPYFWTFGGKITDDNYTKAEGYVNSPESVAALEKIVQLKKDGLTTPNITGGEPGTWDGIKNDYLMIDDGPWFYSLQGEEALNNTVPALLPADKAGSISVVGGEDLVTFSTSKHKEEAWEFMKFMMTPEPQIIMAQTGMIPTNMAAANDQKVLEVPFIKPFIEQLKTAKPRTPHPAWEKMQDSLNIAIEKAIRGEATPKDALDQAAKEMEQFLNE